MSNYLRDLALHYHDIGLVPVPSKNKVSVVKWQKWQFNATRPSRSEIKTLFESDFVSKQGADGVSTTTGETCGRGAIALDADTEENWSKLDALFPDAPWKTKTRKGGHNWFRLPAGCDPRSVRNQVRMLLHHPSGVTVEVDVRGQGGLPVLPGSVHKTGFIYQSVGTSNEWKKEDLERLPVLDLSWEVTIQSYSQEVKAFVPRKKTTLGELFQEWTSAQAAAAAPRPPRPRLPRFSPQGKTPYDRAKSYLDKVPAAVEGAGGDGHTYAVCQAIVRGFDLDDDDAYDLLSDWNLSCSPPWSESELRAKISNARRYGKMPIGLKLEKALPEKYRPKDLSPEQQRAIEEQYELEHREEFDPPTDSAITPEQDVVYDPVEDDSTSRSRENLKDNIRRARYYGFHWTHFDSTFERVNKKRYGLGYFADLLRQVADCRQFSHLGNCPQCHNCKTFARPCDKTGLCRNCAHRLYRAQIAGLTKSWKGDYFYRIRVDVPYGDHAAVRAASKDLRGRIKSAGGPLGRLVEGVDRVLVFYPLKYKHVVESVMWSYGDHDADPKIITKKEAVKEAAGAVLQRYELFDQWQEKKALLECVAFPWIVHRGENRTACSVEVAKDLPWYTLENLRAEENEKWKLEHPGLERNQCDCKVTDADGKEKFCAGERVAWTTTHQISGTKIGTRIGRPYTDKECYQGCLMKHGYEIAIEKYPEPNFSYARIGDAVEASP